MIHSVSSNKKSFKTVRFETGLNVILAERDEKSKKDASRNGSGKTMLVEIIHFCLGAELTNSLLDDNHLEDWTFTLEFDLAGQRCKVSRNTQNPSSVSVEGDVSKEFKDWPKKPEKDLLTNQNLMSVDDWKYVLGHFMFGLKKTEEKQSPSFRALILYFARKGAGAFEDAFTTFLNQPAWSKQVNTAYLLGLSWDYFQKAISVENKLKELRNAQKVVEISSAAGFGDLDELRVKKINLEQKLNISSDRLNSFKVHPQYKEYEVKASDLTKSIHELINQNVSSRKLRDYYTQSIQEEKPADSSLVEKVFKEAGVVFPGKLKHRLKEVSDFHEKVASNRKEYLRSEIAELDKRIEEADKEAEVLTNERAKILTILKEHGAMDEQIKLQNTHNELSAELSVVESELKRLVSIEEEEAKTSVEQKKLALAAKTDFNEREEQWSKAVRLFAEYTDSLYEEPGELVLGVSSAGTLQTKFNIKRKNSEGVRHMTIFCYDLVLMQLWAEMKKNSAFLIHDSSMFDSVDERQIATSIQLANEVSKKQGSQYICCLNTDRVPKGEFEDGFDFDSFVRLRLSDAGESGGLLGIRY